MALPAPPDEDVRRLLATVWTEVASAQHWPRYEMVDRVLYAEHQLDIDAVLARTPQDLLTGGRGRGGAPASPDDQLGLTVAGAAACPGSEAAVDAFLKAVEVSVMVEAQHPREVQQPSVTADQVIAGASDGDTGAVDAETALLVRRVGLLLVHEPWIRSSSLYDGGWAIHPDRRVRRYRNVTDLEEYWRRRSEDVGAPLAEPASGSSARDLFDQKRAAPAAAAAADRLHIEPGLWGFVSGPVLRGEWDHVASAAVRYVESHLRNWAGPDFHGSASSLAGALFGRDAPLALGDDEGQRQGWESLIRGFLMGPRNALQHGLKTDREDLQQFAVGVLGAASLILVEIYRRHPDRKAA